METAPAPNNAWTLLVDPAAAQAIIAHAAGLALPRRICRPLDRRRPVNPELARIDADIEAAADEDALEAELARIDIEAELARIDADIEAAADEDTLEVEAAAA